MGYGVLSLARFTDYPAPKFPKSNVHVTKRFGHQLCLSRKASVTKYPSSKIDNHQKIVTICARTVGVEKNI